MKTRALSALSQPIPPEVLERFKVSMRGRFRDPAKLDLAARTAARAFLIRQNAKTEKVRASIAPGQLEEVAKRVAVGVNDRDPKRRLARARGMVAGYVTRKI